MQHFSEKLSKNIHFSNTVSETERRAWVNRDILYCFKCGYGTDMD